MGEELGGRPPPRVNGALPGPTAEALALEVAEAEAEAEAAEARTAAAQARARAARLRRQALAADNGPGPHQPSPDSADAPDGVTDSGGDPAAPDAVDTPQDAPGLDASHDGVDTDGGAELEQDSAEHGARSRRGSIPVVLAALVTGAMLAVSGYLLWHHHDVADQKQRAAEFAEAARQGVVTLTTLDSGDAQAGVQRILDSSTGAFRDDFQNRAEDFTDVVEKSSVTTEGQVNAAAVESMDDDSAVVLVAATSKVTNSAGADQEPRVWRLSVTVTRDEGQLKMSKVEFVP